MTRIAVLISGHGSNLQAILDAVTSGALPGVEVALVVSNRRDALGIERAIRAGVPTVYFPLAPYRQAGRPRTDYDADLAAILHAFRVQWAVLAGWMHILSEAFFARFGRNVLNLHPALPGQFPGTGAIARAYEAAQRGETDHTGVMVHKVPDEGVDAGPVILQEEVPIYPGESLASLEARIHAVEHRLIVEALQKVL